MPLTCGWRSVIRRRAGIVSKLRLLHHGSCFLCRPRGFQPLIQHIECDLQFQVIRLADRFLPRSVQRPAQFRHVDLDCLA
jgi:hypothetical protein